MDPNATKFGVYLTTAHKPDRSEAAVFDDTIALALEAESLGFESVWLLEHHFTRYGICPDTVTLASYLLGRTSVLKVGTAIAALPLDHPVRYAERVAMIDHLSDGRLLLGVGRGHFPKDFEVFGRDMTRSHLALPEAVEIIQQSWQGPVSGSGEWLFDEVDIRPKPRYDVPILAAATSPTTIEWAARCGIPMMMAYYLEDEMNRAAVELYNSVALAAGHDPDTIEHVISCVVHIASSYEAAREEIFDNYMWWAKEQHRAQEELPRDPDAHKTNYSFHHSMREQGPLRGATSYEQDYFDNMVRLNPVGTPERCAERIAELVDVCQAGRVICGVEGTGHRDMAIVQMQRFVDEVLPMTRKLIAGG